MFPWTQPSGLGGVVRGVKLFKMPGCEGEKDIRDVHAASGGASVRGPDGEDQ